MLQFAAMANLDAIVKQLKQERDRLDAAIKALTSVGGNSSRMLPHKERDGRSARAARK